MDIRKACTELKTLADRHVQNATIGIGGELLYLYLQKKPINKSWIPAEFNGFKVKTQITGMIRACKE